ncbi:MAG: DUF1963 domain-containing protein [Bacilli bacterium]|nr:DUF1963 domain-containing protein [Bacilli bacterium]
MEPLHFGVKRVKKEPNDQLDACKLLGTPVMPADFFEGLGLDEGAYFVAQIRCDQFPAREPFPNKGYLYFFLDIDTLKPKVAYTEKEPEELIDDVNASFDKDSCGDPTCLQMDFSVDGGNRLFGDVDLDIGLEGDTVTAGKLCLLELDALSLPQGKQKPLTFGDFGMGDGHWVFLIREEDLKARRFDKVEFIETEV